MNVGDVYKIKRYKNLIDPEFADSVAIIVNICVITKMIEYKFEEITFQCGFDYFLRNYEFNEKLTNEHTIRDIIE